MNTEDTRRVLEMLAQGKVSVAEAEQLLSALKGEPETAAPPKDPRYCRVTVLEPGKDGAVAEKVNVRVPFSLVRNGVKLGSLIPGFVHGKVKDKIREQGIDIDVLKLLNGPEFETILRDLGEVVVDVNDGGQQVRVRCE